MNYTTTAYLYIIRLQYQNLGAVYIIESEMFTLLIGANEIFRYHVAKGEILLQLCRKKKWFHKFT